MYSLHAHPTHDVGHLLAVRCDGPRCSPVVPSSRETVRAFLRERERGYGYSADDAIKRSFVLVLIDDAIGRRALTRAEAHEALGLAAGTLDDGTLSLDALQAALASLREQPNPGPTP